MPVGPEAYHKLVKLW